MRLRIEARNATIGVHRGRIVASDAPFDVVIRVPDGDLHPGLINSHDHLHRNHFGRLGRPPYEDAYAWGRDIQATDAAAIAAGRARPRRSALLEGAWKNLFAGVTTVVHHDSWESDFERAFPIRVVRMHSIHSLRLATSAEAWSPPPGPFAVHLAEGTNAAASDEIRELARRGLVGPDLLAVHVVGADADGVALLRAAGAAIVWCPASNLFLFGETAPETLLADGIDVLLGTDSLLTGSPTLLDELRCARAQQRASDARLLDAVGRVAARRLGLPVPSLEVGAPADVAIFRAPPFEATVADVALVMVDGQLRVLDPTLVSALGTAASRGHNAARFGVTRWVGADASVAHVRSVEP